MPDNLKLNVKIDADIKRFKAALEAVKKALNALRGVVNDAGEAVDGMGKEVDDLGGKLDKIDGKGRIPGIGQDADAARQRVKGLNSGLGTLARRLGAIAAGYLGFRAAQSIARQIDSYTELNNRIRLVADTERELVNIREELFAISLRTRSSLSANAQLYSRLAQASMSLGVSQTDLLKVTEILNKQVLIGGNNASEAAAGLVQLAQGIASGKLQGDELRSVLENLLGVQQGLVDGFEILYERGELAERITRANLRKAASEGLLTPDLILKSLLAVADQTEARFEQVAVTIGGAFQNLGTAFLGRLGQGDERVGLGRAVAQNIQGLADFVAPPTAIEALRKQLDTGFIDATALSVGQLAGVIREYKDELKDLDSVQTRGASSNLYALRGGAVFDKQRERLQEQIEYLETLKKAAQDAKQAQEDFNRGGVLSARPDQLTQLLNKLKSPAELLGEQFRADMEVLKKRLEQSQVVLDELAARAARRPAAGDLPAVNAGSLRHAEQEELDARRKALDEQDKINAAARKLTAEYHAALTRTPEAQERAQALRERLRALARERVSGAREYRRAVAEIKRADNELTRHFREQEKSRAAAIKSIQAKRLDFLSPFERERAELKKWVQETQEALQTGGAAYAKYRAEVDDIHAKGVDDIAKREREAQRQAIEERIKNSREAAHGLLRAAEEYGREATNAAKNVERAFQRAFGNIENELVRLITKGKFSFKQFARDLAEDSARAVVRIGVTGPIANRLGTALRGRLGLKPPPNPAKDAVDKLNNDLMAKQDQIIDAGEQIEKRAKNQLSEAQQQTALLKRIADCSCSADARLQQLRQFRGGRDGGDRIGDALKVVLGQVISGGVPEFHSGGVVRGRPGQEVLTLLEGGEVVRTRSQEAALAARGAGGPPQQVQVVVENRGANQQEVVEQRAEADGGRLVVNVALDDINRRGPLAQGFERTYGLTRRTG